MRTDFSSSPAAITWGRSEDLQALPSKGPAAAWRCLKNERRIDLGKERAQSPFFFLFSFAFSLEALNVFRTIWEVVVCQSPLISLPTGEVARWLVRRQDAVPHLDRPSGR